MFPKVFKSLLLNNLVMSFTIQPFVLSQVTFFVFSWVALLKLNTAPPLMCPCGCLCYVKCMLYYFLCRLPHSLCSHSLRMSPSLSSLCSSPRSLISSVVRWGGDRAQAAFPPQRGLEQRMRKALCVSFYLRITLCAGSSLKPCLYQLFRGNVSWKCAIK